MKSVYSSQSLALDWTIRDFQERLGVLSDPGHLRIVSGRELSDEVSVVRCVIGHQGILHAVVVITCTKPVTSEERQRSGAASHVYCGGDEAGA